MKTVRGKSYYSEQVRIAPFEDERFLITIHKKRKIGDDEWSPTNINWSSIGPVSLEETQSFARALCYAVQVAYELDEKYRRDHQP